MQYANSVQPTHTSYFKGYILLYPKCQSKIDRYDRYYPRELINTNSAIDETLAAYITKRGNVVKFKYSELNMG